MVMFFVLLQGVYPGDATKNNSRFFTDWCAPISVYVYHARMQTKPLALPKVSSVLSCGITGPYGSFLGEIMISSLRLATPILDLASSTRHSWLL